MAVKFESGSARGDLQASVEFTIDADDIKHLSSALKEVGIFARQKALFRALNRTGGKANTAIARAVVKKGGLKYQAVKRHLHTRRAGSSHLVYQMTGYGRGMKITSGIGAKIGNFKKARWSRQWRGAVWSGQEQGQDGSFMILRKGIRHGGFLDTGVVVTRSSRGRTPLEVEYDDGVAKLMHQVRAIDMAKEKYGQAFPGDLHHELTKGLLYAKNRHGL